MTQFNEFSVEGFRKWVKDHNSEVEDVLPLQHINIKNPLIGLHIESKINTNRLVAKMVSDTENLQELAEDFIKNGGTIKEVEEKRFLISVTSGEFFLHRAYVARH